jgi:hypothetical protein
MAIFRIKPRMGSHYARSGGKLKRLLSGETIECLGTELGNARDKFECLEPDPPPVQQVPELALRVAHRGAGRWDVLHPVSGARINEALLSKEEALAMAGLLPEAEGMDGGS